MGRANSKHHRNVGGDRPTRFDRIPANIKTTIASYLSPVEAIPLTSASAAWQEVAEARTWSSISLDPWRPALTDPKARALWSGDLEDRDDATQSARFKWITSAWDQLVDDVRKTPWRIKHIRALTLVGLPDPARVIFPLLMELAPQLEVLSTRDVGEMLDADNRQHWWYEAHSERCLDLMDAVRHFPRLKHVKLDNLRDLCCDRLLHALRSTPHLEELSIVGVGDTHMGEGDGGSFMMQIQLDRLRKFEVRSEYWSCVFTNIIEGSPSLEKLVVFQAGEVDPDELYTNWDTYPGSSIEEHPSVRDVTLHTTKRQRVFDGKKDWALGLKHLSFLETWGWAYVVHPTLEAIHMAHRTEKRNWRFTGTQATETETGLVAPWVIRLANACPELHLVVRGPHETEAWYHKRLPGFRLSTFVSDDGEVLYHCKIDTSLESPEYVCAPQAPETDDTVKGKGKGKGKGKAKEPKVLADLGFHGDMDLTSFRGWQLPGALLQEVYDTDRALHTDWREGTRGMSLPDVAWEKLRAWRGESEEAA